MRQHNDSGGTLHAWFVLYRPKFEKRDRPQNEADFFRNAEAIFAPRKSGTLVSHHLYVNCAGAKLIEAAITLKFQTPQPFEGVILGAKEAGLIETALREITRRENRPEVQARIQAVTQEFSKARANDPIVTVINADPSLSIQKIHEAELEEERHRAILVSCGGSFSRRFIWRFMNHRAAASPIARLRLVRPDAETPIQLVNELVVMLTSGDWRTLGLSSERAERLWYLFVKLLIEEHGKDAKAIFKCGHPDHARSVEKRIRREMGAGLRAPPWTTKKKRDSGQN